MPPVVHLPLCPWSCGGTGDGPRHYRGFIIADPFAKAVPTPILERRSSSFFVLRRLSRYNPAPGTLNASSFSIFVRRPINTGSAVIFHFICSHTLSDFYLT